MSLGILKFVATGKALPKKIVTNDDISKIVDTSDEWIETRTGIKKRYFCEEESCNSLAIEAAIKTVNRAIKKDSEFDVLKIGLIIVATTSGNYAFPSTACMVGRALGLKGSVMAYDLSAACSGFMYALQNAKALLNEMDKKYALIIGSEELSKLLDFNDRTTCVLFGDGAAAALVKLEDREGISYISSFSDGNDEDLVCEGVGEEKSSIKMKGQAVFKFAVKAIKQSVDEVLLKTGLDMEDIDYVVCHQANARIIDFVKKTYEGHEEKFYQNVGEYANTSAASIGLALDDLFESGKLKKGMKIVCVGFGAGLTWSAGVFEV